MRALGIRLYATAITGWSVYLWVVGPAGGPRAGRILLTVIALWVVSIMPREWSGNGHAAALVQWTAVIAATAIAAVLYTTSVP